MVFQWFYIQFLFFVLKPMAFQRICFRIYHFHIQTNCFSLTLLSNSSSSKMEFFNSYKKQWPRAWDPTPLHQQIWIKFMSIRELYWAYQNNWFKAEATTLKCKSWHSWQKGTHHGLRGHTQKEFILVRQI